MKANDNIPQDEMLLAEAIAAAKANGLKWTARKAFAQHGRWMLDFVPGATTEVCALGALGVSRGTSDVWPLRAELGVTNIIVGNDDANYWLPEDSFGDSGESLGWAFRCAMTQEEP